MNSFFKKIYFLIIGSIFLFSGCKSLPSQEQLHFTSKTIGASTGLIANMANINNESYDVINSIILKIQNDIPGTNQTFSEVWIPLSKKHIEKMLNDKKIDFDKSIIIEKTIKILCSGLDYLFNNRYPRAKEYKNLVLIAIDGFSAGFNSTFKNNEIMAIDETIIIDHCAYKFLEKKLN